MSAVASQNGLCTITDEIARVDRQVLDKKLLDGLRATVGVCSGSTALITNPPFYLNELGLAIKSSRHKEILAGMEAHGADHTLVLGARIGISELAVLEDSILEHVFFVAEHGRVRLEQVADRVV